MESTLEQAIVINRQTQMAIAAGEYEKGQDGIRELEYFKEVADSLDVADIIDGFIEDRWQQTEAA